MNVNTHAHYEEAVYVASSILNGQVLEIKVNDRHSSTFKPSVVPNMESCRVFVDGFLRVHGEEADYIIEDENIILNGPLHNGSSIMIEYDVSDRVRLFNSNPIQRVSSVEMMSTLKGVLNGSDPDCNIYSYNNNLFKDVISDQGSHGSPHTLTTKEYVDMAINAANHDFLDVQRRLHIMESNYRDVLAQATEDLRKCKIINAHLSEELEQSEEDNKFLEESNSILEIKYAEVING